jgi:CRISPR-associated endonuclease/helicase Cas3
VTPTLEAEAFSSFFQEVHGVTPFPWQQTLAAELATTGNWPDVLSLPTGFGKTAALDIALFHLALQADRGTTRQAPVRIAFVVDRRLIVDDAFARAETLARALAHPTGDTTRKVAARLRLLAGETCPPLVVRRMRGGMPREEDWARSPSQPTILCSTVDQVGSRLLFRGYGLSDRAKPIHAGLLGSDCLLLLDEAHLAEPFRQTLRQIQRYRGRDWCLSAETSAPWGIVLLSATPGDTPSTRVFRPSDHDRSHPVLARRWTASKPVRLVKTERSDGKAEGQHDLARRAAGLVAEVLRARALLSGDSHAAPAIAVVVNRVARARAVHQALTATLQGEDTDVVLMIGPARPVERDDLARRILGPIQTGTTQRPHRPLVLVATQCIEAGVDIDLDAVISELASLDSLVQRFGRLNRAGRPIQAYGAIVAEKADLSARTEDPVYGRTLAATWKCLLEWAGPPGRKGDAPSVDFGLSALADRTLPEDTLSPRENAPILMPAHLDLLSQTAPIPLPDPDISLFLHGYRRQPAAVAVIWRADIDLSPEQDDDRTRRLLLLMPPRATEAIALPVWAVRRWLNRATAELDHLSDSGEIAPENDAEKGANPCRKVFRWAGDSDQSAWISPGAIRPGDVILVPAWFGGVDEYGWDPARHTAARDVADNAARAFVGQTFTVRVAPGLLAPAETDAIRRPDEEALARQIASAESRHWRDLRDALLRLDLPGPNRDALLALDRARGRNKRVEVYLDLYGADDKDRPRGVVFVAPVGLAEVEAETVEVSAATEDDSLGSLPGFAQTLEQHSQEVEALARDFAHRCGLPPTRVDDIALAGLMHDAGKADFRFQTLLAAGDPLGPDPDRVLAKSDRRPPVRAATQIGLPPHWRHEGLSVRIAERGDLLKAAPDGELVLWLIGTHHGWGRPFFPYADPRDQDQRTLANGIELPAGHGPNALNWNHGDVDWTGLFERLKRRYGVWELARFEAILRLADHRASEAAWRRTDKGEPS